MRSIASKFSKPFQRISFRQTFSAPRTSISDENAEGVRDAATPHSTSMDGVEGRRVKISARETLDSFSSFRISFKAISFSLSAPNRGGGKAIVFQATVRKETGNEEIVAVKRLHWHDDMKYKKFSNEFVHEVELLAGLSHDNVIRLIGFADELLEEGEAWMLMSWHPNGNVREFIAKGDWEIPERMSLIKDTIEGLAYLHSRQPPICHGDLKSLNILVSSSYRAVITDFGSARALNVMTDRPVNEDRTQEPRRQTDGEASRIQVGASGNQLTLTGPSWSLRWAPPEVLKGGTKNLSSDVWSAGWVCWEIMTNQVPFPELDSEGLITLAVIRGKVPSTREDLQLSQITMLCGLMTDCWAFDPKDRPSIVQCRNEVAWMPSTPPSGVKAPSLDLLLQTGHLHFLHNRLDKAISIFQQALAIGGPEVKADVLDRLGRIYSLQTKYPEAEAAFTQALEIFTLTASNRRADALQGLGEVYYLLIKFPEAEESTTQALQIYDRLGDDYGRANALRVLGHLYRSQTKNSDAEECLTQAREIFTRIGNDHGRAHVLQGLGDVYIAQVKLPEAEECFVQVQNIYTRLGDVHGQANALQGLGQLYHSQGKYPEAKESFLKAQQICTRIGEDLGQAHILRALGNLSHREANYTQAEELYVQAQQIYTRISNDHGRANVLEGLGALYIDQAKYSEAEESLIQAKQTYERIGYDWGRATTLLDLGHLHRLQDRNVQSAEFYAEARDLYGRMGRLADKEHASHWLETVSQA